jgi:uncharacterized protein (DUF305 family)
VSAITWLFEDNQRAAASRAHLNRGGDPLPARPPLRVRGLLALTATLATLSACGGHTATRTVDQGQAGPTVSSAPGSPASATTPSRNAADVEFVQTMIPHHAQAVDMANSVIIGGSNPNVIKLAKQIRQTQEPEIVRLNNILKAWGVLPAGHQGHAQGGGTHGMLTEERMRGFYRTRGAALDRLFLTMMIQHHNGALNMAAAERRDGANDEVLAIAGNIQDSQFVEIAVMKTLLETSR